MERPPKKYVCEKCGYLGNTSEHEDADAAIDKAMEGK